jgi:segregation and condensation protein A
MTYKVKLEVFEGPLDLLLYLIKKEEIDIYDIPISKITDQYLQYLEYMKLLDLSIAGEFIVLAATLMHIKSKMLLPPDQKEEEKIEEDPRTELVRRLLEYKKYKEVAQELAEKAKMQKELFGRGAQEKPVEQEKQEFFEVHLFDLITAFSKILRDIPKEVFHQFVKDEFTVSEKIHEIFHMLVEKPVLYFTELFKKAKNKGEIIAIFLALLELIRLKEIIVFQKSHFSEIEITRNMESVRPSQ